MPRSFIVGGLIILAMLVVTLLALLLRVPDPTGIHHEPAATRPGQTVGPAELLAVRQRSGEPAAPAPDSPPGLAAPDAGSGDDADVPDEVVQPDSAEPAACTVVGGRVLGHDNQPIVGLRVHAVGPDNEPACTDESGRFTLTLDAVVAPQIQLAAFAWLLDPDISAIDLGTHSVRPAGDTDLGDLHPAERGAVRVRVLDSHHNPLVGATVFATIGWGAGRHRAVTTDASGVAWIEALPDGPVAVLAVVDGFVRAEPVGTEIVDGTAAEVELVARRTAGVTVRLVEPDGQPIAGVPLTCHQQPYQVGNSGKNLTTDATGRVRFDLVSGFGYSASAYLDDFVIKNAYFVVAPERPITDPVLIVATRITPKTAQLVVQVAFDGKRPAVSRRDCVTVLHDGSSRPWCVSLAADGTATCMIPAGKHLRVGLRIAGFTAEPVDIVPIEGDNPMTLRARVAPDLILRAVDDSGAPLGGASLRVMHSDMDRWSLNVTTAADGTARVPCQGAAPEPLSVYASWQQARCNGQAVRVPGPDDPSRAADGTVTIDIVIHTGSICGRVVGEQCRQVRYERADRYGSNYADVDRDGFYSIHSLQLGDYHLFVHGDTRAVHVGPCEQAVCDLIATPEPPKEPEAVHVVCGEIRSPAGDLLRNQNFTLAPFGLARTDGDGRFRLSVTGELAPRAFASLQLNGRLHAVAVDVPAVDAPDMRILMPDQATYASVTFEVEDSCGDRLSAEVMLRSRDFDCAIRAKRIGRMLVASRVPPGVWIMHARRDCHVPWEQTITLSAGESARVTIRPVPLDSPPMYRAVH